LLVNGEKMSKSKGNFYTLRDLIQKGYDPMAIRYVLAAVHYRQPLNFTLSGLEEAKEAIKKMDESFSVAQSVLNREDPGSKSDTGAHDFKCELDEKERVMVDHLGDDLNISGALAGLFEAIKIVNKTLGGTRGGDRGVLAGLAITFFSQMDRLFGLQIVPGASERPPRELLEMLQRREQMRKDPNFQSNRALQSESDTIRETARKLGWLLKDGRPGEPSRIQRKRRTWD